MEFTKQIAKHLRDVHFGGNWTCVNLKESLADVSWEEAVTQVYSLNTIATLVYHIHYYINAVSQALDGVMLNAKDEYSFSHPPIQSQEDWGALLDKTWTEAEYFASQIDRLSDSKMEEIFVHEKYGTYYRNLQGIIEHTHYHLGQIVLIKKVLRQMK